jgi:hypothetical protein
LNQLRMSAITIATMLVGVRLSHATTEPFIITYTSHMEELHELEINTKSLTGAPGGASRFGAMALEFEYGATRWWTSEFYLTGQVTANQGALFTGYRWENRFKLLRREHWINPVLYTEFEDLNGADKSLLEVVGHDTKEDFAIPNDIAKQVRKRELENKLILASYFKGFTLAENLIFEKNFAGEPWEFGYALGISRKLPERTGMQLGVEVYGGAGTTESFGLNNTSHYIAPIVTWSSGGSAVRVSPGFGLNGNSAGFLLRVGVSYEVEGFGKAVAKLFH